MVDSEKQSLHVVHRSNPRVVDGCVSYEREEEEEEDIVQDVNLGDLPR